MSLPIDMMALKWECCCTYYGLLLIVALYEEVPLIIMHKYLSYSLEHEMDICFLDEECKISVSLCVHPFSPCFFSDVLYFV